MKKPIEVGQRVAVWVNEEFCGKGQVTELRVGLHARYKVKFDGVVESGNYTRENIRILKPKPKRVCHCNREPDRWAVYDKDGDYFSTEPTRVEAERTIAEIMEDTGVLAGCWFGPMEEVK